MLVSCFGLGLGVAVLIIGFTMDVEDAIAQGAPFLIGGAVVLMAAGWFACWGLLRGHRVEHPAAVTSWSLAIAAVVSVIASTLAGFLAFYFSVLSFVFTMSGDALGLIVVVAAVGAAVPTLLAGLLAVPGLSRAYRAPAPGDLLTTVSAPPVAAPVPMLAAMPHPADPPVRI